MSIISDSRDKTKKNKLVFENINYIEFDFDNIINKNKNNSLIEKNSNEELLFFYDITSIDTIKTQNFYVLENKMYKDTYHRYIDRHNKKYLVDIGYVILYNFFSLISLTDIPTTYIPYFLNNDNNNDILNNYTKKLDIILLMFIRDIKMLIKYEYDFNRLIINTELNTKLTFISLFISNTLEILNTITIIESNKFLYLLNIFNFIFERLIEYNIYIHKINTFENNIMSSFPCYIMIKNIFYYSLINNYFYTNTFNDMDNENFVFKSLLDFRNYKIFVLLTKWIDKILCIDFNEECKIFNFNNKKQMTMYDILFMKEFPSYIRDIYIKQHPNILC